MTDNYLEHRLPGQLLNFPNDVLSGCGCSRLQALERNSDLLTNSEIEHCTVTVPGSALMELVHFNMFGTATQTKHGSATCEKGYHEDHEEEPQTVFKKQAWGE